MDLPCVLNLERESSSPLMSVTSALDEAMSLLSACQYVLVAFSVLELGEFRTFLVARQSCPASVASEGSALRTGFPDFLVIPGGWKVQDFPRKGRSC